MDTEIRTTLDRQLFDLSVKPPDEVVPETIKQIAAADERAIAYQRADAQPVPHHYELLLGEAASPATVPK
jgi:hypothetical protein